MDNIKIEVTKRELMLLCDSLREEKNRLGDILGKNGIYELQSSLTDTYVNMNCLLDKLSEEYRIIK